MKTVEVNNGKKIHVFDNIFEYKIQSNIYDRVTMSQYHIGWNDTGILEKRDMAMELYYIPLSKEIKESIMKNEWYLIKRN